MNNADWWAKKLGNSPQLPVGRPDPSPQMPPSQQPMSPMPTFQAPVVSKAQSASSVETCPDCGSGDYFSATRETSKRCFDCGYPVQQSGSRFGSLTGAHVDGAAKQANGNDTQSNWNPQGIIGRIN